MIDPSEIVLVTDGQLPFRQCLHPSAGFKDIHLPSYYWKFSDLKKEVQFLPAKSNCLFMTIMFLLTVFELTVWRLIESSDTNQRSIEIAANAACSTNFVDISRDITRWVWRFFLSKGCHIVFTFYDFLKCVNNVIKVIWNYYNKSRKLIESIFNKFWCLFCRNGTEVNSRQWLFHKRIQGYGRDRRIDDEVRYGEKKTLFDFFFNNFSMRKFIEINY